MQHVMWQGLKRCAVAWSALLLAVVVAGVAAAAEAPATTGYDRYVVGNLEAPRPATVSAGLMLMGGGKWVGGAFRWFVAKGGHGHFVILRASQGGELGERLFHQVGGVQSVETLVFHSRAAASDPKVLAAVRGADGIFIAGGDQANYVRFWKDTPLAAALDAHVKAGKPIGGTSAGLAILGSHVYGALDGGSMLSKRALADPLNDGMTLVTDFLHLSQLAGIITDTHFSERHRLGRLIGFVAKLRHEGHTKVVGLGLDESAILAVEPDGTSRIFTNKNGFAWLVQPRGAPERVTAGKPLEYRHIDITGIGTQSSFNLRTLKVEHPAFRALADAHDGRLDLRGEVQPLLVIHGGAGVERAGMTPDIEQAVRSALELALRRGYAALHAGQPALDAVTAAITTLEDDPHFNAGKGAVFTHDGKNELDASIMDGSTLAAGGVANVHHVRNPILLARAVMEHSPHVLMFGDGAEQFAKTQQGIQLVDPSYFRTEQRWQQLQQALKEDHKGMQAATRMANLRHFGTVGAVARDTQGRLAAGTSTGGMTDKRFGRVGDSPIIGAGTYANQACAVSGTGWGEYYLRVSAAREICLRVALMGQSVETAGEAVINDEIPAMGGDGGAIILGADGSVATPFNTEGMYRGWIGADGEPHVAIYDTDTLVLPKAQP